MARKTMATMKSHGHPIPVRAATYADFPDCLPRMKWLVEDGLRFPDRMFNSPNIGASNMNAHYCKVCGAAYRKVDYVAHVNEHAEQLNLTKRVGITKKGEVVYTEIEVAKVSEELKLTIIDSLQERLREMDLQFTLNYGLLGDKVARAINDVSKDGGASTPPLCADCEE